MWAGSEVPMNRGAFWLANCSVSCALKCKYKPRSGIRVSGIHARIVTGRINPATVTVSAVFFLLPGNRQAVHKTRIS